MTRKEREITALYADTILEIAKEPESWTSFLKSASYNYKYRFDEQVLIYAQKPEATACAETTIWNKKLKRWINKGSKGIALMTDNNGDLGLRFVFDVSDTNSNVYGKKFKLWSAEEKYKDDIIEALEDKFGTIQDKEDIGNAILTSTMNIVDDNVSDYIEELKEVIKNSKLEQLEDQVLVDTFKSLLIFNIAHLTMSRCEINPYSYFPKEAFEYISEFNTFETISVLGTATRDLSREILLEISKTIINVQKKEKNNIYTFDKDKNKDYDKNIENEKGSVIDYGYNLHNERGLSNARFGITRENEEQSSIRQVRQDEIELSKKSQEGNLHDTINNEQINRPLDTDTGNSQEKNRTDDRTDEDGIWNNRGIESTRPDGMGGTNEQHSSDSRTSSNKGDNSQLEEAENASFFNNETIKNILTNAPNIVKNREDVEKFLRRNIEDKEICREFLTSILGNAYTEFDVNEQRVGYKVNESNINFWKENYLNRTEECFKSWDEIVEYFIADIPSKEEYLNLYHFKAGDIIYIGEKGFTIIAVNEEKMSIYDNDFPLYQETIEIKNIIDKIAENPINDYLKDESRKEEIVKENENLDNSFDKWLDTFLEEKEINLNDTFSIENNDNVHIFEIGNIVENIKATSTKEQAQIKDMLVKIDFNNGSVVDYFKHLAKALVEDYELEKTEQKTEEQTIPNEELAKKISQKNKGIEYFDLHPEISNENRNNYIIKNDKLGVGTPKEKYQRNVAAIKVLKKCEEENRYATPEEQEILANYVGWGGLDQAFNEENNSWANEYYELKSLLTEEEFRNAQKSTLTAFYTPPIVIRNIYKALQEMGLKEANILEPSCRSRKLFRNVTRRFTRKL